MPKRDSKEEWAAKKKQERDAVFTQIADTLAAIRTDNASFMNYLKAQGRFDRYAVNNALLVSAQMPTATLLKSQEEWREDKAYVAAGAKAIRILGPGKPYTREDGTTAQGFDVKRVYDYSQTSAALRPVEHSALTVRQLQRALLDASPATVQAEDELPEPALFDEAQGCIFFQKGQPEPVALLHLAMEEAAAVFYYKYALPRSDTRFKCSCVTWMLLAHFGVELSDTDAPRMPEGYAELTDEQFKKELAAMRDVLRELLRDMYRSLRKEKNK